jgi:hypothetical protein
MMSLQISKAKSATGIALVSAILAGCGGGGGSAPSASAPPPGGFTVGSASCAANQSPETLTNNPAQGALLGSCEEYAASTSPTSASTAFKSAGTNFSLLLNSNVYTIALPVLDVGGSVSISAQSILSSNGGLLTAALGDLSGSTVQLVPPTDTTGAASTIYDFGITKDKSGQPLMNLKHSRYGIYSRFKTRVEGYYGAWDLPNPGASAGIFPTGPTTFRGFIAGVIGRDSASSSVGAVAGLSGEVEIQVDPANINNPVKSVVLKSLNYSSSSSLPITRVAEVTGVVPSASTLTPSAITAEFVNAPTAGVGLSKVFLSGRFYGAGASLVASEIVGTIKFTTMDGRNGIGAFGVKTGALTP